MCLFDHYLLMPTVHAADRIGMNGKRYVLMDAAICPKYSRRVGIVTFVGPDAFDNTHFPFARLDLVDRNLVGRPSIVFCVLFSAPSADLVGTSNHTRTHYFRYPCP